MTTAVHSGLFLDEEMTEAVSLPVAHGRAVVFSSRAPGKTGPNEDGAAVSRIDAERGVLSVADGLGGQPGGAAASEVVLRCQHELLERADRDGSIRAAILDGVELANERVIAMGIGAATTLATLEITSATMRPYHVGDSAILVVGQRGKVKLQTVAHSPVGYGLEAGLLDENEAMHHDERHLISNMVGTADMRIEVGSPLKLAPRDTVLLATDGLFDNLNFDEIVEIIRTKPLEQVAERLAGLTRDRMNAPTEGMPSKPDDLTFVLFRLDPQGRH